MKIEKINENQLRFTLTREDLANRNIKLSELAYGSEKAKKLFREMLQQAVENYGFEVNNKPLMVEAIPVSADSIILIVTKVDNPEELDSRFSHFSAEKNNAASSDNSDNNNTSTGADDILDLIARLDKIRRAAAAKKKGTDGKFPAGAAGSARRSTGSAAGTQDAGSQDDVVSRLSRFYLFHDLDTVISAAQVLSADYQGPNSLYKNPDDGNYYLIIRKGDTDPEVFNRVCNVLSEYSIQGVYEDGLDAFFAEHMTVIVRDKAVQSLRLLRD